MITIFYLYDLQPGKTASIYTVCPSSLRDRLYDMGFSEGTSTECVAAAPFKGPRAYLVRGTLIALRKEDAMTVLVKDN